MKIPKDKLQLMAEDIQVILKALDINPKDLSEAQFNHVWFKTYTCRAYTDNNQNALIKGIRVLPQIENYELYPCDTNDTTLQTGLNYIFKNLLP